MNNIMIVDLGRGTYVRAEDISLVAPYENNIEDNDYYLFKFKNTPLDNVKSVVYLRGEIEVAPAYFSSKTITNRWKKALESKKTLGPINIDASNLSDEDWQNLVDFLKSSSIGLLPLPPVKSE